MRNTLDKPTQIMGRVGNISLVLALSASAIALHTTSVSNQDMPDLLGKTAENRWLMHIEEPIGASIAAIDLEADKKSHVSLASSATAGSQLRVSEVVKSDSTPQRINVAIKGDRVVQTTAKQAPKDFIAGSVLERHSVLKPIESGNKFARTFLKPKTAKEAYQVASLFHVTKPKKPVVPENLPTMVASLVEQSQSSILAYAPEPKAEPSPFSAVLVEEQPIKILPKLNKGDHSWADDPLPKSSFSKRQQRCLAQGIYFEARGEPVKGQAAVSQVILNRVRNPHYPNSICGVVYQNKHWYNRCQFSFACDRIRDRVNDRKRYEVAKHVAAETTAGRIWLPQVGSSTHYHATYVNPRWNRRMKRVGKIGLHIFYRTYGGGWS
ncbi:MAG: cell wall hydrolase [Rhizobiaceae bacterium]|nr:cell wall hydrolase [Rhizobiaceae bacterium]